MNTITIPQNLIRSDDFVVVPRKEYESLLKLRIIKEFTPTLSQKKALCRAERNFNQGKTLSYDKLVAKLGFTNRSRCL